MGSNKSLSSRFIFQRVRFFLSIIFFLFVLPSFFNLSADLLYLKNGDEIEGFFLREYVHKIAFQGLDGKKHIITSSQIERMDIGLSGVPACYTWEGDEPEKKECSVLLVKIDDGEAIFARGKGFRKIKKIDIDELSQIELSYKNYPFQIFPPIQKGFQATVKTKRGQFEGKGLEANKKYITLMDKKGRTRKYRAGAIEKVLLSFTKEALAGAVKKDSSSSPKKAKSKEKAAWFYYPFPGWAQYKQGRKWKGLSMLTASLLCLGGLVSEYSQASSAANKAKESTATANDVAEQRKVFDKHQENQRYYALALLGLYSWHILDLIFVSPKAAPRPSLKSVHKTKQLSFLPIFQEGLQRPALGFTFRESF